MNGREIAVTPGKSAFTAISLLLNCQRWDYILIAISCQLLFLFLLFPAFPFATPAGHGGKPAKETSDRM